MTVGIAKIEAGAAARPFHLSFDQDAVGLQTLSPRVQLGGGNGEGEVNPATAVVRRDRASGKDGRLCRRALAKQEQDLPAWYIQRPKRRARYISDERSESKDALIEFAGVVYIIDIESRFQ
jgi:hypothetical protein